MTAARPAGSRGPAIRLGLGVASLALAVLLLVGFKAPQDGVVMGAARTGAGGGTALGSASSGGSVRGASTTTAGTRTYDGTLVNMRYGTVQVEITVSGGKVVAVTALALPVGGRSGAISDYVGPILSSEAVAAGSASIDLVSGATYTSEAYAQSLQAALDQAGI